MAIDERLLGALHVEELQAKEVHAGHDPHQIFQASTIATLLGGVAFLEAYTTGDEMEGDLEDWHPRSKSQYRRIFADAGLVACGVHCYLNRALSVNAVELELV